MGFGYLFIGYLITFVLKVLADKLQIGSLVLLVGYGTMLLGLCNLRHYCRTFSWAAWTLCPLSLIALYNGLETLSDVFLWNIPFVTSTVSYVMKWGQFFMIMVFHAVLLSAIREIGMQVELKKISASALRNMIIILVYAVVYICSSLPIGIPESIKQYLVLFLWMLLIIWTICNLILLLSCTKNICRAGDEDAPPKRYRWKFLNRLGDAYARTFQNATDRSKRDVEDYLRRKQEKKDAKKLSQQKHIHHKKRK